MNLELGKCYSVLKADGTTITFRFVGGDPPCGEVDGVRITLTELLMGGYISYNECECN